MAKKSRTPPPPRRVQAPRARTAAADPEGDRRRWLILIVLSGLGFVGLGAVALVYALGGGSSDVSAIRDAGCSIETFPAQRRDHVEELEEGFEYNSTPPTSGPHNPQPAPFDVYEEPVAQFRLVHNLEHGAVVIQYGDEIPEAAVDELVAWYRDDPNGIVIAPFPELGDRIALAAWNAEPDQPGGAPEAGRGILALCPGFDEGAFDAYVDAYGFKGPERFPRDALAPGS